MLARAALATRTELATLPGLVKTVLAAAARPIAAITLVAVTLGPGSFTGLRAALALAHGIGLGLDRPVIGVTLAEALRAAVPAGSRPIWVALAGRRDHLFLDTEGELRSWAFAKLPLPHEPVALVGDAATTLAAIWCEAGHDAIDLEIRQVDPIHLADLARRRQAGQLPVLPALPLYGEPAAARISSGLRPAPAA